MNNAYQQVVGRGLDAQMPPAAVSNQIGEQMGALHNSVDTLEKEIVLLAERIASILAPPSEPVNGKDSPKPLVRRSQMADNLSTIVEKINQLRVSLMRIRDSVEL